MINRNALLLLLFLVVAMTSCNIYKKGCCTLRLGVPDCFCPQRCPCVTTCDDDCILEYVPEGCSAEDLSGVDLTEISEEYLRPQILEHEEYTITIGDVLEVSLLEGEENSLTHVVVAPDGMIYYLFLPAIRAYGRRAEEIAEDIREGLSGLYTEPVVAVVPIQKADLSYKIMGQVVMPGVYPLTSAVNLREAIAMSGGLSTGNYRGSTIAMASLANSYVIRDGNKLNIDFKSLIYRGDDSQNIYLKKGDYIHIGSAVSDQIFVLGPRFGQAIPFRDDMTLVGALSPFFLQYQRDPYIAGKWTNVIVIRGRFDCPCVFALDFMKIITGEARDIVLMPGDYIFVPDRDMPFGRVLVRIAIDAFVSSFSSASASAYVVDFVGR